MIQPPPIMPFPPQMPLLLARGPRWVMLRSVVILLKVVAGLIMPFSVLGSAALLLYFNKGGVIANRGFIGVIAAIMPSLLGMIVGLLLWALADLVLLLVAIEHNTRRR
jgi:uncharacterized membrane protein